MARRATYIEQLRREGRNIILVDSGDLFFPPTPNPESVPAQKMVDLIADLYKKTYDLMEYDAFTPGEIDLFYGVRYLQDKWKSAKTPLLVANLMDARSKTPVFQPFMVKKFEGIQVGIFGLISNRFSLPNPEEQGKFYLDDPTECGKRMVAELKKRKCQVIICAAHMGLDEQVMVAHSVPNIDFILSGHVYQTSPEPIKVIDKVQIFFAGARGEHVGQVDFTLGKGGLVSYFQLVDLPEKYADHQKVEGFLNRYKTDYKNLFPAMARIHEVPPSIPGQTFGYVLSPFVGEAACLSCHLQQHQRWQKTEHARAYQTLLKDNKSSDFTCLPCHSTGFEAATDPGSILENVQCEACHGPRQGHPESEKKFLPVSEKQCLVCHNPAKSPNFDYAPYLAKVRCPTPR